MRPFLCHNPDPDLSHCILPFEKKKKSLKVILEYGIVLINKKLKQVLNKLIYLVSYFLKKF